MVEIEVAIDTMRVHTSMHLGQRRVAAFPHRTHGMASLIGHVSRTRRERPGERNAGQVMPSYASQDTDMDLSVLEKVTNAGMNAQIIACHAAKQDGRRPLPRTGNPKRKAWSRLYL